MKGENKMETGKQAYRSADEIIEFLKKHKKMTYQKYGVVKIGIFGSRVKRKEKKESDLDVLIEMRKDKKNLHNFLEFRRFLEKNLGLRVDLGTETALKPMVRESIKDELIYV